MKRQYSYTTTINASRETVWEALLDAEKFKIWSSAFVPGSHYQGSWNKGDKIKFLSPDGKGMLSVIAENKPYEHISIKHIGLIINGEEDTTSEAAKQMAPAFENYTLTDTDGQTEVKIDMDIAEEYEKFFNDSWPKALAKLKALCEN